MKTRSQLIILSLTSALCLAVLAWQPLRAEELIYARLGEYVEALRQQSGTPGIAAAVIGRNGIIWERAFGYQDIEHALPMRTDTPMHLDGLTEMFTASLVLRCVEEGQLSLEDRIGTFSADSPDANITLRQALNYSGSSSENPVFSYRPERLDGLAAAIGVCTGMPFRETVAALLDRLAMVDSVPGPDVVNLVPLPGSTLPIDRYRRSLERLAIPYAVDGQKRVTITQYSAVTLSPTAGLISTVRDLAEFDIALRTGLLLRPETLGSAWRAAGGGSPHGIGWFVQTYNGENVVWQFGTGGNGSSSMWITVPSRSVTFVTLANSNGLVKGFSLSGGDLTVSPLARVFLGLFVPQR